jgi:hypothetical protein
MADFPVYVTKLATLVDQRPIQLRLGTEANRFFFEIFDEQSNRPLARIIAHSARSKLHPKSLSPAWERDF